MGKILMISALFASFLSINSAFAEVEFEAGNQFEAVRLSGNIGVWCDDNRAAGKRQLRTIYCRADMLMPGEFSRVLYTGSEEADEVKVSVTKGNGKRTTKTSDLKNGVSTKNINLWISTLFQRPLLDYGRNQVEYSLTNNGQLVGAGSFEVNVDSLPDRQCRYRTYTAPFPGNCNNMTLCNRYFADENYCE